MSMSAALAGQINIETGGGAGAKPLSVAEERRQRLLETADEVSCPGGCGGMAWLEHAVTTATRDGETRHFRMATCAGECRDGNLRWSPSGTPKGSPKKFEVPVDAPEPRPAHPLPEPEQTATMAARNAVQAAMQARSVNVYMLASDLRLDYTRLRRWLDKGKGLPPQHVERLEQWLATAPSHKPDPTPPKPQQEEPTAMAHGNRKIGRDEEEREKVKAALEKVNWPVVDLAAHIGASRTGFFNWLKMGKGVSAQKVASAVEWAAAVDRGEVEKNLLSRQQRAALTRAGKDPKAQIPARKTPVKALEPRAATFSPGSKGDYISPERIEKAIADWVGPPKDYDEPTPWEAAFSPLLEQGAMDRLAELVGPEAAGAFRVRVVLEARS